MERSSVQKLARALRVLVIVMFVFQIIAMVTRPSYAVMDGSVADGSFSNGEWFNTPQETWDEFFSLYQHDWRRALRWLRVPAWLGIPAWLANPGSWQDSWQAMIFYITPYIGGICTAVILGQGKRVLDTVLAGEPFSVKNAANLRRAAVCCFIISGASLVRLVYALAWNQTIWPLTTNNARFVPAFLMAGLLCMVVSTLFRQAAELKAENDLTI